MCIRLLIASHVTSDDYIGLLVMLHTYINVNHHPLVSVLTQDLSLCTTQILLCMQFRSFHMVFNVGNLSACLLIHTYTVLLNANFACACESWSSLESTVRHVVST